MQPRMSHMASTPSTSKGPKAVPTSKKTPKPGDALHLRGGLLLVHRVVSPDPAEVAGLLLEAGEVPREFGAYVYDNAEDAAAATAEDAVDRRAHAAHWPA